MRPIVVGRNSIEVANSMYEVQGPCDYAYLPQHLRGMKLRGRRIIYACKPEQLPRDMREVLATRWD